MTSFLPPPPRPRSRLRSWRPRPAALVDLALRTALPAAMLLAATLSPALSGRSSATAETLFLAFWAAAVFAPLALLDTARRPVHAGLGLAATLLVATMPPSGGLRPVAVAALLALSVLILGSLELTARPVPRLRTCAALALAMALVLHGHRLYLEGVEGVEGAAGAVGAANQTLSTFALLVLLPAVAAALAARLAAGEGPGALRRATAVALAVLLALQLAAEPWWVGLFFATAGFASGLGSGAGARLAHRGLVLFAAAALLAGSFPWLRAAPVATLLGAVAALDRPVAERLLSERAVVLTRASPSLALELSGAAVRSLVVDSYLTHGVALACGQEIAALALAAAPDESAGHERARAPWNAVLVAGRDSAEWAAGRPDVAAQLACPAPRPWISWIPGAGRFLGQTTRARFVLPQALGARQLVLERNPGLPAETSLAIFFLATER